MNVKITKMGIGGNFSKVCFNIWSKMKNGVTQHFLFNGNKTIMVFH